MSRKTTYEIVMRVKGNETLILRTTDPDELARKHTQMRNDGALHRVKVNGKDVPIVEADRRFLIGHVGLKWQSMDEGDNIVLGRVIAPTNNIDAQ